MAYDLSNEFMARLRKLRSVVNQILRKSPEVGAEIADANELIVQIEEMAIQLERSARHGGSEPAASIGGRRSDEQRDYYLQASASGEYLCEVRSGNDERPFRAPLSVVRAINKYIERASGPVSFKALKHAVEAEIGQMLPDFRLRVVLRFLRKYKLIPPGRSGFKPLAKSNFRSDVDQALKGLSKSPPRRHNPTNSLPPTRTHRRSPPGRPS